MNIIRKIKLKRANVSIKNSSWANSQLDFGEPMFLHTTNADYLAVGNGDATSTGSIVPNSNLKVFKAHTQDIIDNSIFYKNISSYDSSAKSYTLVEDDNTTKVYPKTSASNVFFNAGTSQSDVQTKLSEALTNISTLTNTQSQILIWVLH